MGLVNFFVQYLLLAFCCVFVMFCGGAVEANAEGSVRFDDSEIADYFKYRTKHEKLKVVKLAVDRQIKDVRALVEILRSGGNDGAEVSLVTSSLHQLEEFRASFDEYFFVEKEHSLLKTIAKSEIDNLIHLLESYKASTSASEKNSILNHIELELDSKQDPRLNLEKYPNFKGPGVPGGMTIPGNSNGARVNNPKSSEADDNPELREFDQNSYQDLEKYLYGVSYNSEAKGSWLGRVIDSTFGLFVSTAIAEELYVKPEVSSGVLSCYESVQDYNNNIGLDINLAAKEIEAIESIDSLAYKKITNLAAKLKYSPKNIYEYVKNEIQFEHYSGAVKGALGVLQSGAGNDVDQAALLVALFRASSIPARYVLGDIYIEDKPGHLDWLNVQDLDSAKLALYNAKKKPSNISYQINGNNAFTVEHVWVEACVSFGEYRAAKVSENSFRWVQLDASFKKYEKSVGLDLQAEFNYLEFLSERTKELPIEAYRKKLSDHVREINPNLSYLDVGIRWELAPVKIDFLPDSLPYQIKNYKYWSDSVSSPISALLPVSKIAFANLYIQNQPPISIPMMDFAQHRVSLSFLPVNQSDVDKYMAFIDGGNGSTNELSCPSSNMLMKPIVKVEGNAVDEAFNSFSLCQSGDFRKIEMGVSVSLDGEVLSIVNPGKNAVYFDTISPLDHYAVGAYAFNTSESYIESRKQLLIDSLKTYETVSENVDETVGEFLHVVLLSYMQALSESAREIGSFYGQTGRSGHHIGLTSTKADVEYIFDLPFALQSNNFVIDFPANYVPVTPTKTVSGAPDYAAIRMIAFMGSHLESYIWQKLAMKDAVSTVSGLQIASEDNANEIASFTDAGELEAFINKCGVNNKPCYPSNTVASILNNFVAGKLNSITISKYPLSYNGWYGPVMAVESLDPDQYGGFFGFPILPFSGNFSGGYTLPTFDPGVYKKYNNSISSNYSTGFNIPSYISSIEPSYNTNSISSVSSAVNFGVSDFNVVAGDPVNMVTGNMYHEETDIVIPSRGLPLKFKRTYNSRAPENGPLGWGWTHSFNQYLSFSDSNDNGKLDTLTWVNGTGSKKYIELKGNPSYIGGVLHLPVESTSIPEGFYFSIERNHSSSFSNKKEFVITEKSGIVYRFEGVNGSPGDRARLVAIEDRSGNSIDLSYSEGLLSSVTDEDSRVMSFNYYSDSSLLHTITLEWANLTHEFVYDANDNLIAYRNPLDIDKGINTSVYSYYTSLDGEYSAHQMKSFEYANGYKMTFEYYLNGKVYRHYNSLGESLLFSYNDFRREAASIDDGGRKQIYIFNENGLPLQIVDALGGVEYYFYENENDPMLRTKVIDSMGYETLYEYDEFGNLSKTIQPSGHTVEYSYYNEYGQAGLIKNPLGNYRAEIYDQSGNSTNSIIFKAGYGSQLDLDNFDVAEHADHILAWTKREFNLQGKLVSSRKLKNFFNTELGPYTEHSYTDIENGTEGVVPVSVSYFGDIDGDGVIAGTEGLGTFITQYDELGRVKKGFDARLYPKEFYYDKSGKVVSSSSIYGGTVHYNYDDSGLPVGHQLIAKVDGKIGLSDSSFALYNEANRVVESRDGSGARTEYGYDQYGNLISRLSPDGYLISYEYDSNNRLIAAYDQKGHTVRKELDLIGRIRKLTNPNGHSTNYEYYGPDNNGRLKRVTDPEGRWSEYHYDAVGQVVKLNDSSGRETLTYYDALGRITRIVGSIYNDLELGNVRPVTTYKYNALGHKTHIYAGHTNQQAEESADLLLLQAEYKFDDFGRLLSRKNALGMQWTYSEYDKHGNLKQTQSPLGTINVFAYGAGGLLTSRTASPSVGSGIPSQQISYEYNATGLPTLIQSNHVSFEYKYDSAHRLRKTIDSRGGSIEYFYSVGGMLNSVLDHHGNSTAYHYDPVGRLTGIRTPSNELVGYVYDAGGRLTKKIFPNHLVSSYEYFDDNKIKKISTKNSTGAEIFNLEYAYNASGEKNYSSFYLMGQMQNELEYQYDGAGRLSGVNDLVTSSQIESISYDPYGNRRIRTNGGESKYYKHNALHQLEEIRLDAKTGPLLAEFNYDDSGNLITKSYEGDLTQLTYDAFNRLAGANVSGQISESYLYDHQSRRIQKSSSSILEQYHYIGDDISTSYLNGNWQVANKLFVHGAGIDDPVWFKTQNQEGYFHTDAIGSVMSTTDYSGAVLAYAEYDAWGKVLQTSGIIPQYGYTARESDASGLMYYRSRYYDPEIGRFTQLDPKGFIDGVNRYAYVLNSPVNFVDPWGTSASNYTVVSDSGGYAEYSFLSNYLSSNQTDYRYSEPGIESLMDSFTPLASDLLDFSQGILDTVDSISTNGLFSSQVATSAGLAAIALIPGKVERLGPTKPFALGIDDHLDDFARSHNATTWKQLNDVENWKPQVLDKILDPNQKVLFNLDGVDVWGGLSRSASGRGGATDWELLQIRQNPQSWDTIDFIQDGVTVENPFK